MSAQQVNVKASGGGKGISEFDMVNETLSKYESALDIDMEMEIEGITIQAKMKTQTKQLTSVN